MSEYEEILEELKRLKEEIAGLRRAEYVARAGAARALDTQFPDALLHLPFDGGAPYETDFSVNLFGHKLQRPTAATGGIIGRPGRCGKAVQLAEGTTNLLLNPSFESGNLSGWGSWGTPPTKEVISTDSVYGAYCLRLITNANNQGISFSIPCTVGTSYTWSLYVKVLSGRPTVLIYDAGGTLTGWQAPLQWAGDGKWHHVSQTFVARYTTEPLFIGKSGSGAVGEYLFDAVQVEAKAYPTPYCDGSLGPGHAWTGTPYASTSTRAATRLAYAAPGNIRAEAGTISLWYYMEAETAITQWLFAFYQPNLSERIYIQWEPASHQYYVLMGPSLYMNSAYGGDPSGRWVHIVLTWEGGAFRFCENSALLGTEASTVTTISANNLDIGNNMGVANRQLNGYIDDLLILDRALTADEVRRLYEAGQMGLGVLSPTQSWQPIVGNGVPTGGAPGMTYIDMANSRWYVNVNGAWRYVALT